MLVFLELKGMEIECSDEELVDLGLEIAAGQYKDDDIVLCIVGHNK